MRIFLKTIPLLAIFIASFSAELKASNPFANDSITRADLDPVMISLDSMSYQLFTRDKLFANTAELQKSVNMPREMIPSFSPEEVRKRMKMIPSVISMDYNIDVQAFIDLFVYRRRDLITKLLAGSQIYFPMFEQELDKNGLPDELKYLPVIESALNPQAVSGAGATGLWQLMYSTGKLLGLEGNSFFDERRDPQKSTQAGVRYLKQLYDMYGDWLLALAAYNSGPGYVNKAIARTGGVKNFWAIKNYLPLETRSYVPTFLAVVYVMHYHKDYLLLSAEPRRELYAVDTVMFSAKVTLRHIASVLGMPVEELQFLNPALKVGVVPLLQDGYPLNIPVNYFATFESRKDNILNDPEINGQVASNETYLNPTMVRVPRYIWYKVRKNDNLSAIANRFGVSISEMRDWNHLKGNYLVKGQSLKILTFPEVPAYTVQPQVAVKPVPQVLTSGTKASPDTLKAIPDTSAGAEQVLYYYEKGSNNGAISNPVPQNGRMVQASRSKLPSIQYYKVQQGDSLWSIAQHYPGMTVEKIKSANKISGQNLQKGQVLKIVL